MSYRNLEIWQEAKTLSINDETTDHLDTLYETGSLRNKELYQNLKERLNKLGKKLNLFIQKIEKDLRK